MARESDAVIFLGNRLAGEFALDAGCGMCGGRADCSFFYEKKDTRYGLVDTTDRRSDTLIKGPLCSARVSDLGFATGSALWMATRLLVDARPLISVSLAGQQLGYCRRSHMVTAVCVATLAKNPYVDINPDYHLLNMTKVLENTRKQYVTPRTVTTFDYQQVDPKKERGGVVMARYTGKEAAQEHLLDVAKHVVHAVHKAPLMTGRLKLQTEIITGEDLAPIIEGLEVLAKVSKFVNWDYTTFKESYEAGNPPVLILIGADTTVSEMIWNCGACGFATCAEFNRYSKENRGTGLICGGPCCNWKVLDLGIACDWACAAAWQYNVDNRIQGSSGGVAGTLGYLPGCTSVMGLPLGPSREMVWYSRDVMNRKFSYKDHINTMLASIPTHFMAFPGGGRPVFKAADRWWEANNLIAWGPSEQAEVRLYEVVMEMAELAAKYGPQIEARYSK